MGQNASMISDPLPQRRDVHQESTTLSPEHRAILWEVNIARGCLDSFSRILQAYAFVLSLLVTVNFIGFLQPPKGWDDDTGLMYGGSKAVRAFSVTNTLSLFTAISGLLFYIYCSHSTILSLGAVPIPKPTDDTGLQILLMLRAALRDVVLPSVRRRCSILFAFLACSLTCCVVAYISAGVASLPPKHRFIAVILPSIPGCALLLFFLNIATSKLVLELDFDSRFEVLWSSVAPNITQPRIDPLPCSIKAALDPLPPILSWWYYRCPTSQSETQETPLYQVLPCIKYVRYSRGFVLITSLSCDDLDFSIARYLFLNIGDLDFP